MGKKNDELTEIEELIKKYNRKPEKRIKKRDIVDALKGLDIILPVKCDFSSAETYGEQIESTIMTPDVVKDTSGERLLPLFTTYDQIPDEYLENFSLLRIPMKTAMSYLNNCDDLGGIVLNAFTDYNFEFRKKKKENVPGTTAAYEKPVSNNVVQDKKEAILIYENKKYPLKKFPFLIGRERADIEIPKTYISKLHVVISLKDGKYKIADYDSTNGTKLNGQEMKSKIYYELRDGYEIELAEKEKILFYMN